MKCKISKLKAIWTNKIVLELVFIWHLDNTCRNIRTEYSLSFGLASGIISGTVSVISGGKFANGAVTGAFTYLFNWSLHEANKHWSEGNGKSVFLPLSSIDLSKISASDFNYIGQEKYFNLQSLKYMSEDGPYLGSIKLILVDSNTVIQASPDYYNFDIRGMDFSNMSFDSSTFFNSAIRNYATIVGNVVAGFGKPYQIYLYGKAKIGD